ncbi:MAG: hypothetical protein KBT11_09365 [Treponema sp.]|nr:hypothetical protein [Candidatus Treponema equifaecale]
MMKKNNFFAAAVISLIFLVFSACSSAPKRPMVVTDSYNLSYSRLELANNELIAGDLKNAGLHLSESYDLALSIDNSSLLTKISLSGVMYKISAEKNPEEAVSQPAAGFLQFHKQEIYTDAEAFARRSEQKDELLDLCSIYQVQIKLSEKQGEKNTLLSQLSSAEKSVAKEPYYLAFLNRTRGDVYMLSGDYSSAEKAYLQAADIHTKNRYLAEIGLDWYCVARSRSLMGDKSGARSAIETALKFDRDAENTAAIILDYEAYSKILLKGSPTEAEQKMAAELSEWAKKISTTVRK